MAPAPLMTSPVPSKVTHGNVSAPRGTSEITKATSLTAKVVISLVRFRLVSPTVISLCER